MNPDIWINRAALLEPYDGVGMSAYAIAKATGLTFPTVKRYAEKFGFDFSERASAPIDEIRRLASEGLTRTQVADHLGVSANYVSKLAKDNGFELIHASMGVGVDLGRAEAMAAMYRGGKTLNEIGEVYGVSRERVRQIISKRAGITAAQGGQSIRASRKEQAKAARRDAESYEKYGCSYEQYRSLVNMGKEIMAVGGTRERTPTGAWARQRQTAMSRGLTWNLKLADWWNIWQESGKWDDRGRGKGKYVMCRFGDVGAYEIGNVYIAKCEHNGSFQPNNPYRKGHPDHDEAIASIRSKLVGRRESRRRKHFGLPMGVTVSHKKFQAQISDNGKNVCLGRFDTIEEASAAYEAKRAEIDARYEAAA
jgi:plasmid maintenance system antidote protein VapI